MWKNSASVIEWFRDLGDKSKHTSPALIVEFYPSISEDQLKAALDFAKQHITISQQDTEIIFHSRKSLLFDKDKPWIKREGNSLFDVTMGSYDGAEVCELVCELVGIYVLNILANKYDKSKIGLYRDDGLAAFKNISGSKADKIKKDITKIFKETGLRITIQTNLKVVNFLDITLNLNNGKYYPYRKPNDKPVYIHKQSNHPPNIIKNLPDSISRRISDISHDKEIFNQAAPLYVDALKSCGYSENLHYRDEQPKKSKRNRQRNIIWFNPPFSKNVSTNVGQKFLKLIAKHFPENSRLHKIFNKNTVKVSYSCMPNLANIIKAHNNEVSMDTSTSTQKPCNCRKKDLCPLNGECQSNNIIYNAEVENMRRNEKKVYIGLTEHAFKQRYSNHMQSIRHEKYGNSTELSKYIRQLKKKGKEFKITWSINRRAQAHSNITKRCDLCLTEKLSIINADKTTTLNKRSELVSKCQHENKYYLEHFSRDKT